MRFKLIAVILGIVIVVFGALNIQADSGNWIVDRNRVYVDNNKVYISVEPHTIFSSDWVYLNLTSKIFTGNADFVWGFDTNVMKPTKAEIYDPYYYNTTDSYTCDCDGFVVNFNTSKDTYSACWFNYTTNPKNFWCWQNVTNNVSGQTTYSLLKEQYWEWANLTSGTAYWNVSNYKEWRDLSNRFDSINYNYGGMNKWWYVTNVPIIANQSYLVRIYLKIPFSKDPVNGKYWFALKPSSKTVQQAIQANQFYYIDPWFNVSWAYKKSINITNNNASALPFAYTINFTFNHSELVSQGKSNANGTDIRIIVNDSYEIDRVNLTPWNTSTTKIVFRLVEPIPSEVINYSLYYGNAGAGSPLKDSSNVFLGGDATFKTINNWTEIDDVERINFTNERAEFHFDKNKADNKYVFRNVSHIVNFSDFIVEGQFNITQAEVGVDDEGLFLACASNYGGICDGNAPGDDDSIGFDFYVKTAKVGIREVVNGVIVRDVTTTAGPTLSANTIYWFRASRVGDNATITIYTDELVTILGQVSIDVNGSSGNVFDRVVILTDWETGGTDASQEVAGWLDNLRYRLFTPIGPSVTLGLELLGNATIPNITVDSPLNISYNKSTINLNITVSGNSTAIDAYVYEYNSNGTNFTFTPNTTFVASGSNGAKNIKIFVNDTDGNQNHTTIFFTLNITPPKINIDSPANISYGVPTINLNVSVSGNTSSISSFIYEYNNNGTNNTFTPNTSFIASGANGPKNLKVWVIDALGVQNTTTRFFTLNIVPPAVVIDSPQNINYTIRLIELNVSGIGNTTPIDTFWYEYNGNGTNFTFTPNTTFVASGLEGLQNITVFVNETSGNFNFSSVNFTLDITAPTLSAINPQNDSQIFINTLQIHSFRTNASDATTGLQSVILDFNGVNTTATTITGDTFEVNVTGVSKGIYNFRWYATDFGGLIQASNIFQYSVIDTSNQGSGGAGAGTNTCGNNICDIFETFTTCPQDCKTPQKFTIGPEIHLAQAFPKSEAVCVGMGGCKIIVTNDDPNQILLITTTIRQVGNDQSYQWAEFVPDVIPVNGGPKTQTSFEIEPKKTKVITFKTTVPKEVPLGNYKYNIEFKSLTETKNVAVNLEVVDSSFALAFTGVSNGVNNILNAQLFQTPNSKFGQGTIVVWHILAVIIVIGLVAFIIFRK